MVADILNQTSVRLELTGEHQGHHENIMIESSLDQKTWTAQKSQGLMVVGLEPGRTYYLRAKSGNVISSTAVVTLPPAQSQPTGAGKHTILLNAVIIY